MTKREQILELYKQGITLNEITKKVDTYYPYVHEVVKNYKKDLEIAQLKK